MEFAPKNDDNERLLLLASCGCWGPGHPCGPLFTRSSRRTTIGGRQRPPSAGQKPSIGSFSAGGSAQWKSSAASGRDAWSVADNSLMRRPLLTRLNGPTPSHRRVRNPGPHRDAAFIGFRRTKSRTQTAARRGAPSPSPPADQLLCDAPLQSFISANSSFLPYQKPTRSAPPEKNSFAIQKINRTAVSAIAICQCTHHRPKRENHPADQLWAQIRRSFSALMAGPPLGLTPAG